APGAAGGGDAPHLPGRRLHEFELRGPRGWPAEGGPLRDVLGAHWRRAADPARLRAGGRQHCHHH
ncbi:unnamed protein product, partial [Effrenium voratum]